MRNLYIVVTLFVLSVLATTAHASTVSCYASDSGLVLVISGADSMAHGESALGTYKYIYGDSESEPQRTASTGVGQQKTVINGVRTQSYYTLLGVRLPDDHGGFVIGTYSVASDGTRSFSTNDFQFDCYLNR